MKKISVLFILALLSITGYSQGTIYNSSHFTMNWNRPIWNFGENPDFDASQNRYMHYTENYEADHYGGSLDFGTSFYIHPTGFIDGFKAGIIVDFIDIGINYFTYQDYETQSISGFQVPDEESVSCSDLTGRFSVNVGALATFSPIDNLYFDIYGKLRPTFGIRWHDIVQDFNSDVYYEYYEEGSVIINRQKNDDTHLGFGLLSSFGLDIRYFRFVTGMEFVTGTLNLKSNNTGEKTEYYDQYFKLKFGFFFSEK
ncbi:MAG: hypothetical protein R6U95_02985 [Bacteroidales bacterium]